MSLALSGALLEGETVGLRCDDGAIAAIGPEARRNPATRRSTPAGCRSSMPWVAGRALMRDGVVEGTAEIVARAGERTRRLGM